MIVRIGSSSLKLSSPVRTCLFEDSGKRGERAFGQLLQRASFARTKTYHSLIFLRTFTFATLWMYFRRFFYSLFTLPAIFNMHKLKCLHEFYQCLTRQSMSKNDVIENVLRSLAGDKAANRAPPEIAPSTKSCST